MVVRILKIFCLLICSVIVLSANLTKIYSADDTLVVEGSAVMQNDLPKAKEDATSAAYEAAIKNVLSSLYSEEAIKANEWKLNKLYKQAASFITSSKVLSQKQNTDVDTFDISIQVAVDTPGVKAYMAENGISLSGDKISTILPLIVERTSAQGDGQFWWSGPARTPQLAAAATAAPNAANGTGAGSAGLMTKKSFSDIERALSKYFAQSNFSLIDPYSNELSSNVPETYRYMSLKSADLVKLGLLFGTGLVASGYAWIDCKKNDMLQNVCETNLSLQILSTETGKVIAAKRSQETGTASDLEEAKTVSRARACKTVSDSILHLLTKGWDKRPSSNFKVLIKGLKDYSKYLKIREALIGRQIPGYSNVVERYQSKGTLVFEGERRGDSANIQSNIISKCFPGSNPQILKSGEDFVEIQAM